jgi:hypothetical protein
MKDDERERERRERERDRGKEGRSSRGMNHEKDK